MRLLDVQTFQLMAFMSEHTPAYAILSHRWGPDEATMDDLKDGSYRLKSSFGKIHSACEQATKDGLQFLWVDTFCIDKTSSVELSEAINSMFAWYRDAAICYVYLEDVTHLFETDEDEALELYGPQASFEQTAWFTRGWTLQELLAPRECEFFDCRWRHISSRSAAASTISRITRIPIDLLRHRQPLSGFSLAQHFCWAADRMTTRVEDQAYSLLGLINVNMPVMYGEGNRAFVRLQEELIKANPDLSILAWSGESDSSISPLASRLSNFNRTRSVVQTKRSNGSYWAHEAAMTNIGLRVTGRIMLASDSPGGAKGLCLILNCHYQDDITKSIALRLTKVSWSAGEVLDLSMATGVLECAVGWLGDPPDIRLVMVDVLDVEQAAVERTVIIRRGSLQDITNPAGLVDRKRGWSHLWLRFADAQEGSMWTISEMFPPHHWNQRARTYDLWKAREDQIMREERIPQTARKLTLGLPLFGSVALKHRSGAMFVLFFCFRSPSTTDGMAIELAQYFAPSFRQPGSRLLEKIAHLEQSLNLSDKKVTASLKPKVISEHIVALVTLKVSKRSITTRIGSKIVAGKEPQSTDSDSMVYNPM